MARRPTFVRALVFALAAVFATTAGAATVYSTLDALGHYDTSSAYYVHDFSIDDLREANQFAASQTLYLDQIKLGVAARISASERLTIAIVADAGGIPGAVPLETWTIQNLPLAPDGVGLTGFPLTTVTSVLHPLLSAGTKYWITLRAPDVGNLTDVYWYLASAGTPKGRFAAQSPGYALPGWNGFDNQTQAAFAVTGAPSPRPAVAGLVGVAALAGSRGRRRAGVVA